MTGTFARVWLARLAKPKDGDDGTVYALKVLRKVDGMDLEQNMARFITYNALSYSTQAGGTCPQ